MSDGVSDEPRMFPVLWQGGRDYIAKLKALACPRSVPWEFVVEHAGGCMRNHSQTPERLAERGGLAPAEIVAVITTDGSYKQIHAAWNMTPEQEVARLCELLAEWGRRHPKGERP
jgi:hypothetical protein